MKNKYLRKWQKIIFSAFLTFLIPLSPVIRAAETENTESSSSAALQTRTVTGSVVDATGASLPGVNIVIKGMNTGVVSNADGSFSINVSDGSTVLVFSFVGMKMQEILVGERITLNIIMEDEAAYLEEVVLMGYYSQKRRDAIGSVTKISSGISTPATGSITSSLQGKAAGVYVSGSTVRIRGVNSINRSSEPLWIIDGIEGNGRDLNPNDIESVSVLKDAAATALYGSSGSNGVILITTKSASTQKSNVTVELTHGISHQMGTGWDLMDTKTFFDTQDLMIANAMRYEGRTPYLFAPSKSWDWNSARIPVEYNSMTREEALRNSHKGIDEYMRRGNYTQLYAGITNVFEKGNTMFSLTYRDDKSIAIGASGKKILSRLSLNYSPTRHIHFNFNNVNDFRNNTNESAGSVLLRPPHMPIYDPDHESGYWAPGENPIIRGNSKYSQNRSRSFSSNNYLKLDIDIPFVQGLRVSGVLRGNISTSRGNSWSHKFLREQSNSEISTANESSSYNYSYTQRAEISYNRKFGDHTVGALALTEGIKSYGVPLSAYGYNLTSEYPMMGTPGTMGSMSASRSETGSTAYIGRLTYNFKGKYLLEGNLRQDSHSILPPKNKKAVFSSIGAGWILSDESFWNIQAINLIKIRGSFGKTGNADIPAFVHIPTLTINAAGTGSAYDSYAFTRITNMAADIKWETSDNLDIGVDFGFLNNRINGQIAYFNKETSGLLLRVPLPPTAGVDGTNAVWANVGNMRNNGIEFSVDFAVITGSDFSWNTSYNHTYLNNKVLELEPTVDRSGSGLYEYLSLTKAGGKLATYYLADYAGIDSQKGIPMIKERDKVKFTETGTTEYTGKLVPASSANATSNEIYLDGKSYIPSFFGGWRNTFRYKDFDLNLMISYTGGHYFVDEIDWRTQYFLPGDARFNIKADMLEKSWKNPGDNAKYPELILGGGFYYNNEGNPTTTQNAGAGMYNPNTSEFLKKGDNIQLKEVTLGYNLPKNFSNKMNMNSLRVYFSIYNALYWAKSGKIGNPDVGISGNNLSGAQRGQSFMTRTFSFGLSVNF